VRRIGLIANGPEWLAVLAISGAALLGWHFLGTERVGLYRDDTLYYARMAESITDPARLPYTFRVLTPWLVGRLPLDQVAAFTAITIGTLWATSALLYGLMRLLGSSRFACLGALVLFLTSGLVVRALTTPMYVDPLTYLLTTAAAILLVLGLDWAFAAAVTVGVLNRETALLLLPSYLVARWPLADHAARLRLGAVVGLPVVVLGSVIVWKLAANDLLSVGPATLERLRWAGPGQRALRLGDLMDLFSLFGALWLLAALNLRRLQPELRPLLWYGALVIAQLAVSRGDESRNVSHLFLLVIPLVAIELGRIERVTPNPRQRFALGAALVLAAAASMVHARWTLLPFESIRYVLVAAGTLVVIGLAVLVRLRERSCLNRAGQADRPGLSEGA